MALRIYTGIFRALRRPLRMKTPDRPILTSNGQQQRRQRSRGVPALGVTACQLSKTSPILHPAFPQLLDILALHPITHFVAKLNRLWNRGIRPTRSQPAMDSMHSETSIVKPSLASAW